MEKITKFGDWRFASDDFPSPKDHQIEKENLHDMFHPCHLLKPVDGALGGWIWSRKDVFFSQGTFHKVK